MQNDLNGNPYQVIHLNINTCMQILWHIDPKSFCIGNSAENNQVNDEDVSRKFYFAPKGNKESGNICKYFYCSPEQDIFRTKSVLRCRE